LKLKHSDNDLESAKQSKGRLRGEMSNEDITNDNRDPLPIRFVVSHYSNQMSDVRNVLSDVLVGLDSEASQYSIPHLTQSMRVVKMDKDVSLQ
jgi:hypothetical protein